MSYENKYNESIKMAEYAYNNNSYNVATNRYYYSIYQIMLDIINKEVTKRKQREYMAKHKDKGSHVITALLFEEIITNSVKNKEIYEEKVDFNEKIGELKQLRKKADYSRESITKININDAEKLFGDLVKFIEQYREIQLIEGSENHERRYIKRDKEEVSDN